MRKNISMLLLCMLLAACLTACRASADQRTGEAEGYGGKIRISLTMNGTDITSVKVLEHHETEGVGTRAIDALPKLIEEADGIDVDGVSGATVTSNAIKKAVSQAMGMTGVMQDLIPLDGTNATEAPAMDRLMGTGMAVTGRIGPGKDEEGKQVYSLNAVFACGQFEENGTIRAIQVDQLEVVSPNLGGGNTFSGFPTDAEGEDSFLQEVSSWKTKGAMGEAYMLSSGSWREQMDIYQQMMVGKTVDEVKEWYEGRGGSSAAASSETEATTAADGGTAQPAAGQSADAGTANTGASQTDAASGATMSLQSEYGDILLAIERAWEDAKQGQDGGASTNNTMVDTNTLTDATEGENNVG